MHEFKPVGVVAITAMTEIVQVSVRMRVHDAALDARAHALAEQSRFVRNEMSRLTYSLCLRRSLHSNTCSIPLHSRSLR